ERDRPRLHTTFQLVQPTGRGFVVRLGGQSVDRVERQHDRPAGTQRLVDVVHGRRPSTTRSVPVRSRVIVTSVYRNSRSELATSSAWPSPTSSTSQRVTAARAICSCRPTPTRAPRGSHSRISGWSASHSSGATYGGLEMTRSQPSMATSKPPSLISTGN